ncbi:sigma-54-dependent Fis family transcriptional regulator [Pseudonocardia alni]|uniref:sigma-54-dependent Fis family transcriptional regulator n=1 Tax=Pseudonocardia alni TaxID=33907 RepID=UPI00280B4F91|nr:helix-turn-helix domain-containing protein [Pseudonocardia alni]
MGDLLARRRELVSARAELLDRPDVVLPGVPGHVVASWRRSIAGGVDPAMIVNRFHPDLDTGSRLVRCARPVMEQLVEQVAGIGVCVALTDHRARLLVRLDTDAVIARSADVNAFAAGFGYAEGAVGTNGVGTVLESGLPVHIVGAEHFVEQLHDYACAGAPVRDPATGRIEAVLDLSCRAEHSSPLLLSLVRSAAARISDALLHDRDPAQQALFDAYARTESRTRRAVLAVGRRTVLANTAMQTLLDAGDHAALTDHARFLLLRGPGVDDRVDLPSGTRARLRGAVVPVGGSVAGLVAVVTLLREPDGGGPAGPVAATPRPDAAGVSPAWRAARAVVAGALGAGEPLLVTGEPGSGRARLVTDSWPGPVVEVGPDDDGADLEDRVRRAGRRALVLLRDLDRRDAGVPPAVARGDLPTAGTRADTAVPDPVRDAVLARFRVSVPVPPLRGRPGDLPGLVAALLAELAPGRDVRLSAGALRTVSRHPWPGNVTELRDALTAALGRRPVGVVEATDLPESCQSAPSGTLRAVDRAERDAIVAALRDTDGNRAAAAAALGVARSTLYRKIAQYRITD